ncbi:hypothetical protein [Cellulomonas sp. URHD0024]|uniref:hypothetical protein n=1 Tax=Cellulomonas sp. URHD0024 TaxID=1302620 RepID=UPI0004084863|nr:hypothetical protein [Cellulomonas sp. URHD0024]
MNDLAGPVALALVGLWVAYLVPHKLRHRQQLLESRADDRFSEALRVVAVTSRASPSAASQATTAASSTAGLLTPGKGLPVQIGSATGGTTVDRPHGMQDRITADAARRAAQARAARAAAVARRAAAARRRAVLAGLLLLATVAGWAAFAVVPTVGWVVGVAPTVLLSTVLVLGRRAVLAGREADAEWEARIADERRVAGAPRTGAQRAVATAAATARSAATEATSASAGSAPRAARPAAKTATAEQFAAAARTASAAKAASRTAAASGKAAHTDPSSVAGPEQAADPAARDRRESTLPFVTGRAIHPSDASTEVFERIVEDQGETGGLARHATGAIPVVRRSALTGPTAQVAEQPAEDEAWSPIPVPRPTYTMKASAPRREPAPLENLEGSTAARTSTVADATSEAVEDVRGPLEAPVETTGSIDLNAVLAKRRVAGE